ncbi:thiaminase II [Rhodothermus marinus]|uniref:thiaminase II n=1 Tax=Rhodothermus marinus TaxID=29549 RepID=UPI0012BA4B4C|nr:thiaminase II [Rhodothermus marinus]BBM70785.1 aminopyrimidine aminohydrolase [Rhodothermus marinus]
MQQEAPVQERPFTVPPFAQECLEAAADAWGASFRHPFVRALAEGTLDAERFRFYQMQDARYLEAFADACSLIATRCVRPDDKLWFIDAARLALVVERELHAGYGKKLGYTLEDVARIELTPNNRAYQDHMIATAVRGTLVEAVAAITPCPWLYVELGQHLARELGTIPDTHPYADWLRMYSNPEFNTYMDNLLERLERFAREADGAARARAKEAFRTSVRYEWMFWQQAWEQQRWPV